MNNEEFNQNFEEISKIGQKMMDEFTYSVSTKADVGSIYGKDTMLVTEDFAYPIQLIPVFGAGFFDEYKDPNAKMKFPELEKNVAYLDGEYYYLYRGKIAKRSEAVRPGIYLVNETLNKDGEVNSRECIIKAPETDEEKIEFSYEGRLQNLDPDAIVEQLKGTKQVLKLSMPGSSKIFIPEVCKDDDLLKRAIKEVLIQKNIDIDQYRYRFPDKNALFNFKQVLKKDGAKLSMLLFERGCEALNLKYAIVIEEADPEAPLGLPMEGPIRIASDDTYDL